MNLGEYFLDVATTYDRLAGLDTPAQRMLTNAPALLAEHAPAGIVIQGSGGKGVATYTPWVGFFNPDETSTPQRGIYAVYLMSEDLELLALTLNQGMEFLRKDLGDRRARARLALDAAAITGALPDGRPPGFNDTIDLRSNGARQKAYEAGNIACRMYSLGSMPSESELRSDLSSVLALYEQAIDVARHLLLTSPGTIASPSTTPASPHSDPLVNFHPKDDSDYKATIVGKALVKSRRHEKLVRDYGQWSSAQGFRPSTEHPQDLILRRDSDLLLVEAKMVYRGNATEAVRAAVGQLLAYSYFLHIAPNKPALVGLFSEDIGAAYVAFMESLDMAVVWWNLGSWSGSMRARSLGLTSHGS